MDFLPYFSVILATVFFFYKRSLRYLRFLQQDEYNTERFINWLNSKKSFDRRGSTVASLGFVINLVSNENWFVFIVNLLLAFSLACLIAREPNPINAGKLRLVLTPRAKRILYLSYVYFFVFLATLLTLTSKASFSKFYVLLWLLLILLFQATPFILVLSIRTLAIDEKRRQNYYMEDAKRIFASVSPLTIGITGSYGKSSVKNILGEIIQITLGSCFWPTKGINTIMGISSAIRSKLSNDFKFAVVEMAAYRKGSIAKLCDFTPPQAAIITAIGLMHLERFGSTDAIYEAKTELARALPPDGILVCNGDDPGARRAASDFGTSNTHLYGFDNSKNDLSCWITEYTLRTSGTNFQIQWQGQLYSGQTKLLGSPALSNIMAAFTMACALGAQPDYVLGAICNLKPLENRLSVNKTDKATYIMDAYNSNPLGFASALEVLAKMPAKRRILFTPGMIELGDQQHLQNSRLSEESAKVCDQIFVIGTENRSAFLEGLEKANFPKDKIVICDTRDIGFKILNEKIEQDDLILIENDLPDLYEGIEAF